MEVPQPIWETFSPAPLLQVDKLSQMSSLNLQVTGCGHWTVLLLGYGINHAKSLVRFR